MSTNCDENNREKSIILKKPIDNSIENDFSSLIFSEVKSSSLENTLSSVAHDNIRVAVEAVKKAIDSNRLKSMIEPISKAAKEISDLYSPVFSSFISNIKKLLDKIDWSEYDLIYKEIAIRYMHNGFYPYYDTEIDYKELLKTSNKTKQVKIIKDGIKKDIKHKKKDLLFTFPKYKKIINEVYSLYKSRNYRLCILSIMNLISTINNTQFEFVDFTEKQEIRTALYKLKIMKEKEHNYMIFSPYIDDKDLSINNQLLKDYRRTPEKYLDVPYCRNAILHGYSKKFGTEANCLRWFSVLFNTLAISQFVNIEKELSNIN